MRSPDPISEWNQDEISKWINGLDAGLESYKEALKFATGDQLLNAKYSDLYKYGITKIGHQEALLDAILLLDETVREIRFGSLKSTAKKLVEKCIKLQNLRVVVPSERTPDHPSGIDPFSASQLSNEHFQMALEVLTGVRHLINNLQAYSSSGFNGSVLHGHTQDHAQLAKLALELSRTALLPLPALTSVEPITHCCFELCQLANRIQSSPYAHEQPILNTVIIKRNVEFSLGLFLRMRQDDGRLEITGTKNGADAKDKIFAGDELIAINGQIVVGWSLNNVVNLLKSCRVCHNQCDGFCNDFDAKLTIKRSYVNSEYAVCYQSHNEYVVPEIYESGSRSTPEVNMCTQSASRRRSAISHSDRERREKPRLSLPPPPLEPYQPKVPQVTDVTAQRAHSLGNLTGSESPNSLMDAATFAVSHRNNSTQKECAAPITPHGNMSEDRIEPTESTKVEANPHLSNSYYGTGPSSSNDETESFDTEQSLIEKLKSCSITPNSSLPRRVINNDLMDLALFDSPARSTSSIVHDTRKLSGPNSSIHSHLSERSKNSNSQVDNITKEATDGVTQRKQPLNDISHEKETNWNKFGHYNKSRDYISRCRSEPRLTEKQSLDYLSDGLSSRKPLLLKSYIWQKEMSKNILKPKWNKYWAVLQNSTLYVYYDQTETEMIQEPLILYGQKVTPPENKCSRKYSFQLIGSRCDVLLAAESADARTKWMNALGLAAIGYKEISSNVERRSGPDLTKITTGITKQGDHYSPNLEAQSNLSYKSKSVENINKVRPILMRDINLEKKISSARSKTDILDIVLDEKGAEIDEDKLSVTSGVSRPRSCFLETDF